MRMNQIMRGLFVLGSGMMLLQAGGCTFTQFNDFLQTILLGVTAAGAVVIIRNI